MDKISQCFHHILTQTHAFGQLESMNPILMQSFEMFEQYKSIPADVRQTFTTVILTLHHDQYKVRFAIQTLNWNVTGEQGADAFLSLEIQAQQYQQRHKRDTREEQTGRDERDYDVVHID